MNCIHDDIIQKYIDGEANPEEVALVERHITRCNKCGVRIENQRKLATGVKKAINLLSKDTIEIPKFEIPSRNIKKNSLKTKKLLYLIAAASVLLFVIGITQKNELKRKDEIMVEIGSVMDVDANRPVSKFPLVINIIDAKGNISEYLIK
jgi:predicted anti-sigma-YlaC factor YlaD